MNLEKEIFDISLQDIIPNRFQPREMFDDNALQELSQSIREHGVIQPIIVRKVGDKYEIIAGERRFRASQLAGKQTIPALVRDIDDKEAAKIALLENLQRSNLTPIEEAKTYQTILKLDNITQDELAKNLGKSQSTIANKLRLLTLDEEVQTALLNSQISERHARSLIGLDLNTQKQLLHRIISEKLTVKALDDEIMRITGKVSEEPKAEVPPQNEGRISMDITQNPLAQSQVAGVQMQEANQGMQEMPKERNIGYPQMQSNYNIQQQNNEQQPITPQIQIKPELKAMEQTPIEQMPTQNINPEPVQNISPELNQNINSVQTPEINIQPTPNAMPEQTIMPEHKENIFDKLRVTQEKEEPKIMPAPIINSEPTTTTPEGTLGNIYDLRFAINNFRQAIQNTEKFGFKVKADEYDSPDKYQIVIEIEKKN